MVSILQEAPVENSILSVGRPWKQAVSSRLGHFEQDDRLTSATTFSTPPSFAFAPFDTVSRSPAAPEVNISGTPRTSPHHLEPTPQPCDVQPCTSANSLLATSHSYVPVSITRQSTNLVTATRDDIPFLVILALPLRSFILSLTPPDHGPI